MSDVGSTICIGLCCLDLVAKSDQFPSEDSDQRVPSIDWHVGGNAAHNATILSALGSKTVYFAGSLPDPNSVNAKFICQEFAKHSIDASLCKSHEGSECPVSMVIVSNANGSRTILHCRRNFPEFAFTDFQMEQIATTNVSWIHFEGRYNISDIVAMLKQVKSLNERPFGRKICSSVELEKQVTEFCKPLRDSDVHFKIYKNSGSRSCTAYRVFECTRRTMCTFIINSAALLTNVDVVFLSKEFAQFHGAHDKVAAVELFRCKVDPGAAVVCAWGALGCAGSINPPDAAANPADAVMVSIDAVPPPGGAGGVVDTLGAGDTFVAGCVFGFQRRWRLRLVLEFAAELAGVKCGQPNGFNDAADWAPGVAAKFAARTG